jgi:hypothetical protein
MANKQTRLGLAFATVMAVLIANSASAQVGPATPGPTGAPKVGPSMAVPGRTPPIGGPVVLEPPTTTPPPVPRGAREALQGQVVREVGQRRTFTQRCPRSEPGHYSRFASITGRLQKGSTLVVRGDCFGNDATGLSLSVRRENGVTSFFLPNIDDGSNNFGWATFGLFSSSWTPAQILFPVIYNPDPNAQPIIPPLVVRLELRAKNGVHFRADLSQQDIDTLNSGGTLSNPQTSSR